MSWNDESWKDSYDAWKLASPDDDYGPQNECFHVSFEIDYEGRAHCDDCDYEWWPSAEESRWFREAQKRYDAHCRREERRERWKRATYWFRWPLFRLLDRFWPSKSCNVLTNDEIPF